MGASADGPGNKHWRLAGRARVKTDRKGVVREHEKPLKGIPLPWFSLSALLCAMENNGEVNINTKVATAKPIVDKEVNVANMTSTYSYFLLNRVKCNATPMKTVIADVTIEVIDVALAQ